MRKRIIRPVQQEDVSPDPEWLNIVEIAEVELTSEDPGHPIENALQPGHDSGWRAAEPGKQTIRLLFDRPQQLTRIRLHFVEPSSERTQEHVLSWSADGESFHEIVRQQWNFSPEGATSDTEDLEVELSAVTVLELTIIPNISGGAIASLAELRLA